jgi:hypothetical protein
MSTYKPEGNNGLSRSDLYGYGRINALEAVKEAQNHVRTMSSSTSRMEGGIDIAKRRKTEKVTFVSNDTIKRMDESKWLNYSG